MRLGTQNVDKSSAPTRRRQSFSLYLKIFYRRATVDTSIRPKRKTFRYRRQAFAHAGYMQLEWPPAIPHLSTVRLWRIEGLPGASTRAGGGATPLPQPRGSTEPPRVSQRPLRATPSQRGLDLDAPAAADPRFRQLHAQHPVL